MEYADFSLFKSLAEYNRYPVSEQIILHLDKIMLCRISQEHYLCQ